MCAEYTLKAKAKDIWKKFEIPTPEDIVEDLELHVRGYMKTEKAPVVFQNEKGNLEVRDMCFSLCPAWSKEFPCKFTTYNARMERDNPKKPGIIEKIYEVPSWKESFIKGQTCLVPMNGAIESSYFGKSAGHIVQFSERNNTMFFAAGLWTTWINKLTGECQDTFTLITDDPYQFFFDHGHDRSVFVLNEAHHHTWLANKKLTPEKRFEFLRKNRVSLDWNASKVREMKSTWLKNVPTETDLKAIKVWKEKDA